VAGVALVALALGSRLTPWSLFVWQVWHLATGDIDAHFVWQAWHSELTHTFSNA